MALWPKTIRIIEGVQDSYDIKAWRLEPEYKPEKDAEYQEANFKRIHDIELMKNKFDDEENYSLHNEFEEYAIRNTCYDYKKLLLEPYSINWRHSR